MTELIFIEARLFRLLSYRALANGYGRNTYSMHYLTWLGILVARMGKIGLIALRYNTNYVQIPVVLIAF